MDTLIFLGVLAVAVALIIWRLRKLTPPPVQPLPAARPRQEKPAERPGSGFVEPETRFVETSTRKPYQLLNSAEQVLYHRLREAMPNMIIFGQVGLAQLANLRGRKAMEDTRAMLGRSVDFLVCREDFAILAAIELTWPTPEGYAKPDPEIAKRAALERLGIPLIVFRPNQLPDPDTISREIAEAIVRRNHLEAERERQRAQNSQFSQMSQF